MNNNESQNEPEIRGELAKKIANQTWNCRECGSKNTGIARSCAKCGRKINASNRMRVLGRLVIIFSITFAIVFIIVFYS